MSGIPWLDDLKKEAAATAKNSAYIKAQKPTARIYPCAISHHRLLALIAIAEAAQNVMRSTEPGWDSLWDELESAEKTP